MIRRADRGFTLIELLTVIAIIAILAAITFAAFPRIREKARISQLKGLMNQMRITLAQYYAEHQSYPPGYGFVIQTKNPDDTFDRDPNPIPFMGILRVYGTEDLHDPFSEGYDGNRDGLIQPMEFSPIASKNDVTQQEAFVPPTIADADGIYRADAPPSQIVVAADPDVEYDTLDRRPLYYMPVNTDQFKRAERYWRSQAAATAYPDGTTAYLAATWDPTDPQLAPLYDSNNRYIVPPRYDAYVLISVGPGFSTFNIVPTTDPPNVPRNADEYFNIQALRAYFLATRDLNDDKLPDFHYDARRTGGAEANGAQTYPFDNGNTRNWLPDALAPQGYGPYIFPSG